MRGLALVCLLVTVHLGGAATLTPDASRAACDAKDLTATAKTLVEGLSSIYCNGGQKGPRAFLGAHFDRVTHNGTVMSKRGLTKGIIAALHSKAKGLRSRLQATKPKCVEDLKTLISGGKKGNLTKTKFVGAFLAILSMKPCHGVKIYGKTNESTKTVTKVQQPSLARKKNVINAAIIKSKQDPHEKIPDITSSVDFEYRNPFINLGGKVAVPTGKCTKSDLEATKEGITNAFTVIFCNKKAEKKGQLKPDAFLKGWFAKSAKKAKSLPKDAFLKDVLQSVPWQALETRLHLLSLKPECAETLKQELAGKGSKTSEANFLSYFTPLLEKQNLCQDVKIYKKDVKKCQDLQVIPAPGFGHRANEQSNSTEIIRKPFYFMTAILGRGYLYFMKRKQQCTKEDLEETKKTILEGFKVLFCSEGACKPDLKPTPFLRDYFNKHCSKIYFLPRRALRSELAESLPNEVTELRERLRELKSKCIVEFKRIVAKKHHGKIDRAKFMSHFLPLLSKPKLCDDIQSYYKPKKCSKQGSKNSTAVLTALEKEKPSKHVIVVPLLIQKIEMARNTFISGKPFFGNEKEGKEKTKA